MFSFRHGEALSFKRYPICSGNELCLSNYFVSLFRNFTHPTLITRFNPDLGQALPPRFNSLERLDIDLRMYLRPTTRQSRHVLFCHPHGDNKNHVMRYFFIELPTANSYNTDLRNSLQKRAE